MIYHTYEPHPDLRSVVKYYWTLEVPFDPNNEKQKIIPDGCIEMTFNLKDPIKKHLSESEFIIQSNCMIMGQRTKSFDIEPVGDVQSFAVCFYPFGFSSLISEPLGSFVDQDLSIEALFGKPVASELEQKIFDANNTEERIRIIEAFLFARLHENTSLDKLISHTVDLLIETNGKLSIGTILENDPSQRRQLERKFKKHIGISPKRLSRIIRLQTALKLILSEDQNLTRIAYESDYFDQSHFIKDFKEFIGSTPKQMLNQKGNLQLSSLFYGES